MDLMAEFKQFVGREVPLAKSTVEVPCRGGGVRTVERLEPVDPQDPTLAAMRDLAAQNRLRLRILWPGRAQDNTISTGRISVHIEEDGAGKWRVADRFECG